jgi:DUF4097 and DUF4098 domain-containing protein YvlB
MQSAAFAECPVVEDGALFVRVAGGNIIVATSGSDVVRVEVSNSRVEFEEQCFDDHIEIDGTVPERVYGPLDWRITVPKSINLDLITMAGYIRIANTDGNVTARTMSGSVSVGDVGGNVAIVTQGGSILAEDIDGNAELRSSGGGQIEIGNVAGNAELETLFGAITTGIIEGRVHAETESGSITIAESRGQLDAGTLAGDILIGTAGRTVVRTAGGNISADLVRGPFIGTTDLGNIRIDRAESYIDATSGTGDISARLIPVSLDGDLHVSLKTASGAVYLEIPEDLPADIDATVGRATGREPIRSDFSLETVRSGPVLPGVSGRSFPGSRVEHRGEINGGGNAIVLEANRGSIEVRRAR